MAMTDHQLLRSLLGEEIPLGGSAADTYFTNEAIDDLLARHGTAEASLGEAWTRKAALLAGLVDITEGSSQRKLSQLHAQALTQAALYGTGTGTGIARTQVHRIVRRGVNG